MPVKICRKPALHREVGIDDPAMGIGGEGKPVKMIQQGRYQGSLIAPAASYSHDVGRAVIGGVVYRGTAMPEKYGRYWPSGPP